MNKISMAFTREKERDRELPKIPNVKAVVFLFCLSFFFLGFSIKANASTDCTNIATTGVPQIECEALIALYTSTNGAGWTTSTNWNTASAISTWYSVAVSGGHVTSLNLWNNNLSGPIPTEIGNLVNLTFLQLSGSLTGSIPSTIENLVNLTTLTIVGGAALTGSLPSEIGNLTKISSLYMTGNFTTGPIPASWSALTKMTALTLINCHLSGPIPAFIGTFNLLTSLQLYGNSLTSIPAELGNLTNLVTLNLSNNALAGSIPSDFGNLTKLVTLNLSNNALAGSIPSDFGNLTKLVTLGLNVNSLSGVIPPAIASIPTLVTFNIITNKFVFSDFESQFSVYNSHTFIYNSQGLVDTVRSLTFTSGGTMTIIPSVGANTNDIYQWYKDGSTIPGATSRVYTKTATDNDGGVYSYRITNSVVTGLTLQSNSITVSIIPNPPTLDSVYYIVSGTDAWVRGSISNNKDMAQKYITFKTTGNSNFEFSAAYIISSTAANSIAAYQSGTFLNGGGDEATPINTGNVGYINGNHGLISPLVTSVGHDKTSSDIGSVWSDGIHQFVLTSISGNELSFYSVPFGSPWSMYYGVAGTLTHVSGATHTASIMVTSQVATQHFPIVKNVVHHIIANGVTEIISGDSGYADYVDMTEEFDLIDPSSIVRTNNPWIWNDGEVWVHVKNVYRATAGTTVVHTTYNILRPMNIGYFGIIQVAPITASAYDHQYYYVPKTKPVSGYNFKATQLLDSAPANQVSFNSTYIDDVNNPPDRQVVFWKRNADSNYDVGFAFGYSSYGATAANERNCVSGSLGCWWIYTSKKTYPVVIGGIGVVDDVTYDAYAYRQWIDPKQYDIGKSVYWNNQNGHDLVYVDYHRSANNDETLLPSKYQGKAIKVIESENIQTPDRIISDDGILTLSTTESNTYGYAVLELVEAPSNPTNFSATPTRRDITLTVDSFQNDTASSSGYYFLRSDGINSGWIQTNSWQDTGLNCNTNYTYSVKYRNSDNIETEPVTLTQKTKSCNKPIYTTQEEINPTVAEQPSTNNTPETTKEEPKETNTPKPEPAPPATVTPPSPTFSTYLKQGSEGAEVTKLQTFLIEAGYSLPAGATGYFGTQTQTALSNYQKDNNITPTGTLGPITRNYIQNNNVITTNTENTIKYTFTRNLELNSTGEDVRQLQIYLNNNGYTIAESGTGSKGNESTFYGEKTKQAIKKLQEAHRTEILTPYNFKSGTGMFYEVTRKFVNSN